jgi:hypothetical protein
MIRILLPAGLVLVGLLALEGTTNWHARLDAVERAPRITSEELNALEARVEVQQANADATFARALADQAQNARQRALQDAELIAGLQSQLERQRTSLDEQRAMLSEWERDWNELTPNVLQRELFQLRAGQDEQALALQLAQRKHDERELRVAIEMRALTGRIERTMVGPDTEQLWNELVGPVVQLIGDTTVGSGVLLQSRPADNGGWTTNVLTAWHVVRDIFGAPDRFNTPIPIKVYAPDGSWKSLNARLLMRDVPLDLALLELDTKEHMPFGAQLATRAQLSAMHTFDGVYAVGCPLGNDPIPTTGELASTHHEVDGSKYWMISAPTYIGNSGGGIYCAKSHALIGIFSKIYTHGSTRSTIVPHMGLATPLATVYDWLESSEYAYLEPQAVQADTQTAAAVR